MHLATSRNRCLRLCGCRHEMHVGRHPEPAGLMRGQNKLSEQAIAKPRKTRLDEMFKTFRRMVNDPLGRTLSVR